MNNITNEGVNIEYELVRVPKKIVVDGKTYPRTRRNLEAVADYVDHQDKAKLLNKLSDIVLEFS